MKLPVANFKLSAIKFDHRFAYIVAGLVIVFGYLFVFRGFEDAIGTEQTTADAARIATERNLDRVRRRAALQVEHRRLTHELAGIDVRSDRTTIVARFVGDVASIAAREHVRLISLEADRSNATLPTATQSAPVSGRVATATATGVASPAPLTAGPHAQSMIANGSGAPVGLEPIPLLLTLQGDYAHILGGVLGLAHSHVLAQVDVQSLERLRGAPHGQSPELTAKIHVTLFRQLPPQQAVVQGVIDAHTRPS